MGPLDVGRATRSLDRTRREHVRATLARPRPSQATASGVGVAHAKRSTKGKGKQGSPTRSEAPLKRNPTQARAQSREETSHGKI